MICYIPRIVESDAQFLTFEQKPCSSIAPSDIFNKNIFRVQTSIFHYCNDQLFKKKKKFDVGKYH